mgnify:CR=1 FL=1
MMWVVVLSYMWYCGSSHFISNMADQSAKSENMKRITEALNSTSAQPNRSIVLTICQRDTAQIQRQIQPLLNNGYTLRGTLNNLSYDCANVLFVKP